MCYKPFYSLNRLSRAAGARHVPCYQEGARRTTAIRDVYNVANCHRWNNIYKHQCCIDTDSADARPDELDDYIPTTIVVDRHCLYCAISLSTFDNKDDHIYARLKTVLELCLHRSHYDIHSAAYTGQIHDVSFMVSGYWTLLTIQCGYSEMMHIYACCAALGQAVDSYYPLPSDVTSFSKNVTGRDVTTDTNTSVTCLVWTMCVCQQTRCLSLRTTSACSKEKQTRPSMPPPPLFVKASD